MRHRLSRQEHQLSVKKVVKYCYISKIFPFALGRVYVSAVKGSMWIDMHKSSNGGFEVQVADFKELVLRRS